MRPRRVARIALLLSSSLAAASLGVWLGGSLLLGGGGRSSVRFVSPPGTVVEAVHFPATDGVPLRGWWLPGRDPERAVVLLHGWKADRRAMVPRARWLQEFGYSILLFDFRGCGESGGRITFGHDERFDVEGALRFLRDQKKVRRTVLLGQSAGAAAALMAVDRWEGVRGLILESVYDRFENAVRARVRERLGSLEPAVSPLLLWQVRPRLGFRASDLAPVERLREVRCPVLIITGGRDPHLTPASVRDLFAAVPPPATLWVPQRARHTDFYRFDPKGYRDRIGEFLGKTLGPPDRECTG